MNPCTAPGRLFLITLFFSLVAADLAAQSWGQAAVLTAHDRTIDGQLGESVSVSGNYAVAGSPRDDGVADGKPYILNAGGAYIYYNDAGTWKQIKKLYQPVRSFASGFGFSVFLYGNTLVVGAPSDSWDAAEMNQISGAGSVYIFNKDQGGPDAWGLVKKITAPVRAQDNIFGISVSMDDDYLVVGACNEAFSAGHLSGGAYVFKKDQGGAGNWGLIKRIVSDDIAREDYFGCDIAISGDHIVVGALGESDDPVNVHNAGAAYVFAKNTGGSDNWGQIKKLSAPVKNAEDNFGNSVAIEGDFIVIGSPAEDEDALEGNDLGNSGSAYLYGRNYGGAGNWGLQKKIVAGDRSSLASFGLSVAIQNETIVIGAPYESMNAQGNKFVNFAGAAYIFSKDQGGPDSWGQVRKLVASNRSDEDYFGRSVSIEGMNTIVGANQENNGVLQTFTYPGAAYIFNYDSPLPVRLASFDVSSDESAALLTWTTTEESNSDRFEIQRSTNGRQWYILGEVKSHGESINIETYTFLDSQPNVGENLYRLKMVDKDGSFTYSRIRNLAFSPIQIGVYPNPVSERLFIKDVNTVIQFTMHDLSGKRVIEHTRVDQSGIDISNLANGVHTATIKHSDGHESRHKILITN